MNLKTNNDEDAHHLILRLYNYSNQDSVYINETRIENPEINIHMHSSLISSKSAKEIQW